MPPLRYGQFLRRRYRAILAYTGLVTVLLGILILSPLMALLAWPEETAELPWFLLPGGGLALLGAVLWWRMKPAQPMVLTLQEGAVIVVLCWLAAMLAGSIPFLGKTGLSFSQAVFEATSGWTTTGLSVVDVTRASNLILLYRSTMQLAGGAGLAILMLAAFGGPLGAGLSTAEGKDQQLVPHVRRSTKLVVSIYTGYVLAGVVALRWAGMNWFDAVNHSFCAVSTGGFSTKPDSIGYWNSPLVEAVVIPLMILGNLNFLTSYALLRGRFRWVFRNGEVRLQALLLPLGCCFLFLTATKLSYPSLSKAVRVAIFESVTALTTTGYSTVDYGAWPSAAMMLFIVFMFIGGGVCSTAGGIKQFRVYLMWRALCWELRRLLLPEFAVIPQEVWQGESRQMVKDSQLRQVGIFIFIYLMFFLAGAGLLACYGYSVANSLFEFASALGTVGLSVGKTGPKTPSPVLWAQTLAMLLGRLEFMMVGVGLGKILTDSRTLLRKN